MPVEMKIRLLGLKNLAKLRPDSQAFYREANTYLVAAFRRHAKASELPDGSSAAPLSEWAKHVKAKMGKSQQRDWDKTGQLLPAMQGRVTKSGGLRIGFSGSRRQGRGQVRRVRGKDGLKMSKRKTNQWIANMTALVDRNRKQLKESYSARPPHAWVEPSKSDWTRLYEMLRKNLQKVLVRMPKGMIG